MNLLWFLALVCHYWLFWAIPARQDRSNVNTIGEKKSLREPGAYKPVVRLPSSSNDDDVVFDYKVPGTETSLHLVMDLDIGLRPGIVQRLLSRALLLVTSILDVAGDGIVPGQRFTQDYEDMYGYGLSVGIWSDRIIHDRMTYSVLRDTLVGLWDRMVTHRLAYQTVIHVSREDVGIVAFGIVRWVSEDTAA